ncbi:Aste57867_8942 [Aphanomyces stellatus]|uniref:Aste57867_8942 protein n=1 Tax=Aphanomyces stellatus TaxID=120398 RepID=A0A485KLI3_9STRA|nr:hypothetical protein As57867_008907 [Aphanomyces stellatus]VFT85826.1 Aste57867_8942 [Aphanomyces stellatus]
MVSAAPCDQSKPPTFSTFFGRTLKELVVLCVSVNEVHFEFCIAQPINMFFATQKHDQLPQATRARKIAAWFKSLLSNDQRSSCRANTSEEDAAKHSLALRFEHDMHAQAMSMTGPGGK